MITKIKNKKYIILEIILIFIVTLLYNLICASFSGDEIWNYGFSYNIANGLIPYKDFNMIITPLYPMIGAIFLLIFGKSLITYHIFHALICTLLFLCIKKIITNNYYLVYIILLLHAYPSYNIFCILLLYLIMINEEKHTKKNNYIIGILLGLTAITKQNIGILLCIPTIFLKDFKRIIGFLIPISILLIYVLINNCFYQFVDYTILGIFSFAQGNYSTNKIYLIIIIISTLYLIYEYIKTKDIKLIYLLSFQLVSFPMLDYYHFMISIFPTIGYIINKFNTKKFIVLTASITFIVSSFGINIIKIYQGEYDFINSTNTYKYRKIPTELVDSIISVSNSLQKFDNEFYIICKNAYIYKLEANIPINTYDLLNDGNMGYEGQNKIIKEINQNCHNKKCTFLVDTTEMTQDLKYTYGHEIITYIQQNYSYEENIEYLLVFQNY